MLRLIEQHAQGRRLAEGKRLPTEQGTPQGGIVSPFLSNILLTPFDREMRRRGYRLTRYADDWVVTCRTRAEAQPGAGRGHQDPDDAGRDAEREKTRIVHVTTRLRVSGVQDQAGTAGPCSWPRARSVAVSVRGPLRVSSGEVDRALQGPDSSADPAEGSGAVPGADRRDQSGHPRLGPVFLQGPRPQALRPARPLDPATPLVATIQAMAMSGLETLPERQLYGEYGTRATGLSDSFLATYVADAPL